MNTVFLPDNFFEWVLRSSAVLIVVWLLSWIPRVPAWLRHGWLAAGMIVALVMPVFMTRLPSWSPGPLTRYVLVPSAPPPEVVIQFPAAEPLPSASERAASLPALKATELPVRTSALPPVRPSSEFSAVAVLWLAGACLLGLRLLLAAFSWQRAVRSAAPLPGPVGMDVRVSSRTLSPVSGGLWRTAVLLPVDSIHWSPARMHAVLAHEEAHLRRRDAWWLLLGHLLCAVQWFNPLAWLVHRRALLLREEACDESALQRGVPAIEYAEALLALASPRGLTAVGSPMARCAGLERRIRSVLNPARIRPSRNRAAVTFSVVLLCAVTFCASVLRSQEKLVPAPIPVPAPTPAQKAADIMPIPPLALVPEPDDTVRKATTPDSEKLSGEIILDPGGWISPPTNLGATVAFAQTLAFCVRVKENLETDKLKVFLTRSENTVCPLEQRIRLMGEHPAAIVLSVQPGDCEEQGHQGVAAGVAVIREGPSLSHPLIMAHYILKAFALPQTPRLAPVYLSKDPLLAACARNTAAVILHTGSEPRDWKARNDLYHNTLGAFRDFLRLPALPSGKPAERILNGFHQTVAPDRTTFREGNGIATAEIDGSPCVLRWTAEHGEYTLTGPKLDTIDTIDLSGDPAMQILGTSSTEISSADRLSVSLLKQTMHVEGRFEIRCHDKGKGHWFKGEKAQSTADFSADGKSSMTDCSIRVLER